MKHDGNCRSNCPVNYALEMFGDIWSLLIVRDIIMRGRQTYGEFLASREKISTNILADRLTKLEEHGIISKQPHETDKRKDTYGLTEKGEDLYPVLLEMVLWSAKYDLKSPVPEGFITHVKRNKQRFTKEKLRTYIAERIVPVVYPIQAENNGDKTKKPKRSRKR